MVWLAVLVTDSVIRRQMDGRIRQSARPNAAGADSAPPPYIDRAGLGTLMLTMCLQ
jgi:hypothetical protein